MIFNSWQFLIFFPIVTTLYFLLSGRLRLWLLLISSCIFYMFFIPKYLLILFVLIAVDFIAGRLIEKAPKHCKKLFLIISLAANIGFLGIFKYYNFFAGNFIGLGNLFGLHYPLPLLDIILPIGLSFHTFQAMAYTIEVYRGKQKAEKDLLIYALYVMFFPQLVAGPIERPQNLLPQFKILHNFDYDRVVSGLRQMLWGMFKKVVIADHMAIIANFVYNDPTKYTGITLITATVAFTIQIYCDFSGYSDIAIGAARVLGFKLMTNFNRPYFSENISEFWRRWHISLSSWFRDYVFFPLGGNRCGLLIWIRNIYIVFILSGFWHGANWTFIIWGVLHATYYFMFTLLEKIPFYRRVPSFIKIILTFSLVTFAWIFFRANDLIDAIYIVSHLFTGVSEYLTFCYDYLLKFITGNATVINNLQLIAPFKIEISLISYPIAFLGFIILIGTDILGDKAISHRLFGKVIYRWILYCMLILLVLNLGVIGENTFIYFQF